MTGPAACPREKKKRRVFLENKIIAVEQREELWEEDEAFRRTLSSSRSKNLKQRSPNHSNRPKRRCRCLRRQWSLRERLASGQTHVPIVSFSHPFLWPPSMVRCRKVSQLVRHSQTILRFYAIRRRRRDQVEVLKNQLQLAKTLNKPASVHCVRAFGELLEMMKSMGPFPAGVILHSYLGSAEMVPEFSKLGAYFSFSGFLMSLKANKAKKMLQMVPSDRILLETDAPDALPKSNIDSLFFVDGDPSLPEEPQGRSSTSSSASGTSLNDGSQVLTDASTLPKETLNHPANIHLVLDYVASMLEITKEELAELSYQNAVRVFSYEGSKVLHA
ncbi:uncharacterized protein LOC107471923 isoform X1 [Arachis duranensis]|uniref:Uncharacterized protein LOC107471923 isoform X1 n=1 Tax=Arachis duranensis TaxID=130453 RepID=A0A6P5MUJ4_ARADU|nr:uncharacterized protein LOC107471923 isoform X1 [Arachis duranensis]